MLVATLIAVPHFKLPEDLLQEIAQNLGEAVSLSWLALDEAADLLCPGVPEEKLRTTLKDELSNQPVDIIIQDTSKRRKKLLLADMESTIIEQEMLDELAEVIGQRDTVADITRRAMNGELDFAAALKERVGLLKGQSAKILDQVAERITMMPGAKALVATMKKNGAICRLVSGGFTCFAGPVAQQLQFDNVYANELIIRDGALVGEVTEPILDRNAKKDLFEKSVAELKLSLADGLCVGDGANDVPMLLRCIEGGGMGIAYQAKPKVRDAVRHQINHTDLTSLLYAQGYKKSEIIF